MADLRYRKFIVIVTFIIILAGCEQTHQSLLTNINRIDYLIERSEWKAASKELNKMYNVFESNKWKLEFSGSSLDYATLVMEMGKLEGAIESKDKIQAKMEIEAIKALIRRYLSSG